MITMNRTEDDLTILRTYKSLVHGGTVGEVVYIKPLRLYRAHNRYKGKYLSFRSLNSAETYACSGLARNVIN